jgi:hypothetical protein
MIRAAVALLVSISLLGCFPHNPRARTYAQIGEGTAVLGGIAISAFAQTGADCDDMKMVGVDNSDCRTKAKWLSTIGVTLIVAGLLGFVATVSTAEEAELPKPVEIKDTTPKPAETPAVTTPPPADTTTTPPADGTGTGSADPNAPGAGSAAPQ